MVPTLSPGTEFLEWIPDLRRGFLALSEGFEDFNSKATTEGMKYNTIRIFLQVHCSTTT